MREHGEYAIVIEGNVVHCYFDGGINIETTISFFDQLEQTVSALDRWIWFVHTTRDSAGTPDSGDYALNFIAKLHNLGCIAYALQVNNIVVNYYAQKITNLVPVPFLASKSETELNTFIEPFVDLLG